MPPKTKTEILKSLTRIVKNPAYEVRSSPVHGLGVFALRRIRKGSRIIEYMGERVNAGEADVRYDDDPSEHPLVLLFTVNKNTYLDAGVRGNDARYINHSCLPNCEAVIERGRVYIHALRTVEPGEELAYDYNLTRDDEGDQDLEGRYACHCGVPQCRGTMLAPQKTRKRRSKVKQPISRS